MYIYIYIHTCSQVLAITGSDSDILGCLVCFSSFMNRRVLKRSEMYLDGLTVLLTGCHSSFNLVKGESCSWPSIRLCVAWTQEARMAPAVLTDVQGVPQGTFPHATLPCEGQGGILFLDLSPVTWN